VPQSPAAGAQAATKDARRPTGIAEHRPPRRFVVPLTTRTPDMTKDEIAPGDMAPQGTAGTGDNVCPDCNGSGQVDGGTCPTCLGTGRVIEGVGGA
jgi:hypothetical protein